MKNRIGLFAVIIVAFVAFTACDELGSADKPSNKTLALFAFNDDDTLDTMGRYDGTAYGSPVYQAGKGTETLTTPQAIVLNGSSQYVDVPDLTQSFAGDFSVAAWVYLDALPGAGDVFPIVSKGSGPNSAEFAFSVDSSGNLSLTLGNGSGGYVVTTTGGPVGTGSWHYAAATVADNNVALYVDPTDTDYDPAATGTSFTGTRITGDASLQVGRYVNGASTYLFAGIVDQVRIANYAYDGYGLGEIHDAEE